MASIQSDPKSQQVLDCVGETGKRVEDLRITQIIQSFPLPAKFVSFLTNGVQVVADVGDGVEDELGATL